MSYRYNTIDIIVGVGLCAILCGALLVFAAANGTYQVVRPQALVSEQPATSEIGMRALQPTFGQALLDQAVFERRANQAMTQSVSEWNRATLAFHEFVSGSRSALGSVIHHAQTVPANHLARVEGIKGRAIVNFTKRGVRNGLLSGDQFGTIYNMKMIGAVEAQGLRLHDEFISTWQAMLGHHIVEAAQQDWLQARTIQERLGTALVQVVQVQTRSEQGRAVQQEQLASLIFASARHTTSAEVAVQTTIPATSQDIAVASTEPASWPEIPISYLIAAGLMLATVFLGSLSLAARNREARVLAQLRQDADRWTFRMAA
ncbi:MAG: hypothetical protein WBK08_16705 [Nitrospira sp.]|jgi:hypothetical protein|nr:MAG: hypothetical protein E8D42_03435 [Nitrospira sp.]